MLTSSQIRRENQETLRLAQDRIKERKNHPTLSAETPGWTLVLSKFLNDHQPANFRGDERSPSQWNLPVKNEEDTDFLFDAHIEVDPALSPVVNTLHIVEQLGKLFPHRFSGISEEVVSKAVVEVLEAEKKELPPRSPSSSPAVSPSKRPIRPSYCGIHFEPSAVQQIIGVVNSLPGLKPLSTYENRNPLEKAGGPHVTVLYMGSKKDSDLTGGSPFFSFFQNAVKVV